MANWGLKFASFRDEEITEGLIALSDLYVNVKWVMYAR